MIGNSELETLGDKLQTTLVELMRCREREARYRQESQALLCGVATLAQAKSLEQVLDSLILALKPFIGFEQADVVGNSFGGAVALWMAWRAPERTGRLVLMGAAATIGHFMLILGYMRAPAATLTPERADQLGIDREQCRKSLDLLRAHPEVREKLVEVFNQEFAGSNDSDPDTQLYAGFFGHGDKSTMDLVRATPADLLGEREFAFSDPRLPEMLFRYRARNWPHTLSEAEQKRWRLHCSDYFSRRLPDYVPRLEALAEQNQGNERNFAILKSLYHYLEDL